MTEYIYLVVLFPLLGFMLNGFLWNSLPKKTAGYIASAAMLASFVISLVIFFEIKDDPAAGGVVHLFDFIRSGSVNIPFSFQVDALSTLFLLIITGVGFLIHVYSIGYMQGDPGFNKYFAFLNFFVFSMLLLVLGANYVIMFIGWEGVGLASYLLIGFWYKNPEFTTAGKKAFIINRIGDLGFLIGLFLTLYYFGTASYAEFFPQLTSGVALNTGELPSWVLTAIAGCFFVGAMGKSAQIPLYTWLPDAMAGPTPVSALIHAATMVTAGIYMIARSHALYNLAPIAQNAVAIVGLATALFAATIALKQYDIKKILAYSTISQLGYMFLALGVGSYVGGVFHVMTHAFFKALLFLCAGSVIHGMSGEQDLRKMGGLGKYMRITQITFLIGCLAISGIPGFSGFFSKDEILAAAYAQNPIFYYLGLLGALMTAFYVFRLYFYVFSGNFRGTEAQKQKLHESPWIMIVPLIVLAVFAVIAGYIGLPEVFSDHHLLAEYLAPVLQNFHVSQLAHSTEWTLMGISVTLIIGMIGWAYVACRNTSFEKYTGLSKVFQHGWYVERLYYHCIEKPIALAGHFGDKILDRKGIDGFVNGLGALVNKGSDRVRLLQNGQVGFYLFAMVVGMVALFAVGLWMV